MRYITYVQHKLNITDSNQILCTIVDLHMVVRHNSYNVHVNCHANTASKMLSGINYASHVLSKQVMASMLALQT